MSSSRSPSDQPQKPKPRRISDLPYTTLRKLSNRLDTLNDGKESYWRKVIEVMPSLGYDQTTVEKFALNANKQDGSPAYALLTDMGNRGVAYDELISALKKLHLNTALHDLGYREAIKFTIQPEASPVVEGQRLELECKASGVPGPTYLWFKLRDPLPEQTQRLLIIDPVQKSDEGMYCCRASNEVNIVFSNWAEIKVMKPPILNSSAVPIPQANAPEILTQPQEIVNLQVREPLHLVVFAQGSGNLSYQWFRNGSKLPYGDGNELVIEAIRLGDQGVYNCRVTSDLGGSVMSGDSTVRVVESRQVAMAPQQVAMAPQQVAMAPPQQQMIAQQGQISPMTTSTYMTDHTPTPMTGHIPSMVPGGPTHNMPPPLVQSPYLQHSVMTLLENTAPLMHSHDHQNMHYDTPVDPGHPMVGVAYPTMPGGGGMLADQTYVPAHDSRGLISGQGGQTRTEDMPCGQGITEPDLDDTCYDKVALLIGNKNYRQGALQLNTPENDTLLLAGVLRSAGFKVVSLVNLSKREMSQAVRFFASLIGKNVYALFFFAGHGFEVGGKNFMMPVDADIDKRPEQCECAQDILRTMQTRGAKLSIVLLDMCRVSASTPTPSEIQLPSFQGTNGYFVIGFSCSPAERAFEAGNDSSIREDERENSIFVAALREHLQQGSLKDRLDNLLTDAAAGVRKRGKLIKTPLGSWMKPEIRHNLGEKLSLADEIKNDREVDFERQKRADLWQEAHLVPDTSVVYCHGNLRYNVKQGELALRLHFEAEHSNVLLVTTELLNGCLTSVDILSVEMSLHSENQVALKAEMDKQYKYLERSKFGRHQSFARPNDLMHFKIVDIQKIKSQQVVLAIWVEYTIESPGESRLKKNCEIHHSLYPPLYAKILCGTLQEEMQGPLFPSHVTAYHHGNMQ